MKNVLISGGAGFIGSRLCEKLFERGYKVTILDNLSTQIHGDNDSYLLDKIKDKCIFIKGDVRNKSDWIKAIKNQDFIIHLAAETGTGQSMYDISNYTEVNVLGTAKMLEALSETKSKVKKIILASSRAVYGEGKYICLQKERFLFPLQRSEKDLKNAQFEIKDNNSLLKYVATDENSELHPLSIYAINKLQQEQMVLFMGRTLGMQVVCLRYQNVYGPGQSLSNPYTGILSVFSTRILNNNDIDIYEDGLQTRDFVYIDDVVEATTLAIKKNIVSNEIINIGSGTSTTVKDVANILKKHFQSNIKVSISGKYRVGDIRHNFADITKAKEILNFNPKFNFQEGVINFVQWVKNQNIMRDNYDYSVNELKEKGLLK